MVNQARISADINGKDLSSAAGAISSYLSGKEQTPQQKAAAEAFLNALPPEQVANLKFLNDKKNYTGPKLEPGVTYGIWIDHGKILRDSLQAEEDMENDLRDLTKSNPSLKEKLLEVIDTSKAGQKPAVTAPFVSSPKELSVAPIELAVQQQQAYLKLLGFDIGKAGLDGIAGKGSLTQKALDDFAQKNGIDPKDTAKVNQVLSTGAMKTHSTLSPVILLKDIENGKLTAEDIKINQWILKGSGFAMTSSLRGNKMDGVAGTETKIALKNITPIGNDDFGDKKERFGAIDDVKHSRYREDPARGFKGDQDPMSLFRDNLRDMLKPLTDALAEIGTMIQKEMSHIAEDAGLKKGLSGDFGKAVAAVTGMDDKVEMRDRLQPASAQPQAGIKLG